MDESESGRLALFGHAVGVQLLVVQVHNPRVEHVVAGQSPDER